MGEAYRRLEGNYIKRATTCKNTGRRKEGCGGRGVAEGWGCYTLRGNTRCRVARILRGRYDFVSLG